MKFSIVMLLTLSWMSSVGASLTQSHCGEGQYLKTRSFRRRRSQRTLCMPCQAGRHKTFKSHLDSYCDKCESGRYQPDIGQPNCLGTKCSPGQWGPVELTKVTETVCHACLEGHYSPNMGQESCQSCPSGLYSTGKGSSSCLGTQECPIGKWGPEFATAPTTCRVCPVGTYGYNKGTFWCPTCPKGKYNLREGQTECLSEPSCPRWYRVEKVNYTCVTIYPLRLYRLLVSVAWITVVVNIVSLCCGDRSMGMVPCSPFMGFGAMGIAIWLSVPRPGALQNGMKDWEYGVLLGLFVSNLLGWAWCYLTLYQRIRRFNRDLEQKKQSNSTKAVSVGRIVAEV